MYVLQKKKQEILKLRARRELVNVGRFGERKMKDKMIYVNLKVSSKQKQKYLKL